MTDLAIRPGYNWLGVPIAVERGPRCGLCRDHHIDVAAIRACYAYDADQRQAAEDDYRAELAVERYFEDRGYDDARAQDEYEARNGAVGFIDAWHAASPESCPCDQHEEDR